MQDPEHAAAHSSASAGGSSRWWLGLVGASAALLGAVWPWLRIPAAVAIGLVLLLACCQSWLIYIPPRHGPAERPRGPAGVQVVAYGSAAAPQQAYYVPPRRPAAAPRLWLVFGGNASCALDWGSFVQACPDETADFLLIDYPGYGANAGSPSPGRIQAAIAAALHALAAQLGVAEGDLIARSAVLGHSLGAAVALGWASTHKACRIVLVAPFTSMLDMARRTVGWPLCEVLVHRFDNRASLDRIIAAGSPPITIIHGTADEVIPCAMGRELAQRHAGVVRLIEVRDAGHNDVLARADQLIYEAMMR